MHQYLWYKFTNSGLISISFNFDFIYMKYLWHIQFIYFENNVFLIFLFLCVSGILTWIKYPNERFLLLLFKKKLRNEKQSKWNVDIKTTYDRKFRKQFRAPWCLSVIQDAWWKVDEMVLQHASVHESIANGPSGTAYLPWLFRYI